MKAYLFLAIAISSELFGTSMLKASNGFTKFWPSLGVLLGFGLLSMRFPHRFSTFHSALRMPFGLA